MNQVFKIKYIILFHKFKYFQYKGINENQAYNKLCQNAAKEAIFEFWSSKEALI
jgi:hypothetical protein